MKFGLYEINSNDIVDVQVLCDVVVVSIYGVCFGNGVIVVIMK